MPPNYCLTLLGHDGKQYCRCAIGHNFGHWFIKGERVPSRGGWHFTGKLNGTCTATFTGSYLDHNGIGYQHVTILFLR